jgi:hypothetical protein
MVPVFALGSASGIAFFGEFLGCGHMGLFGSGSDLEREPAQVFRQGFADSESRLQKRSSRNAMSASVVLWCRKMRWSSPLTANPQEQVRLASAQLLVHEAR